MRVLRGVVYMTKSSGPRTEPWGTPQENVCQENRSVIHLTRKGRDDRYGLNQLRTEPWIPNQDERRVISTPTATITTIIRAAVGTEFLSPYPSRTHRKSCWYPPQDSHTHRTPKSYIPIPAPCLFTTRGLF